MSPTDRSTSRLINLQYELAMLVGRSLRLEPMLRQFFPAALKSLGCKAAHVWLRDDLQGQPTLRFSYPARDHLRWQDNDSFRAAASQLFQPDVHGRIWDLDGDHHLLALSMGDVGVCTLTRQGRAIETRSIAALTPIFQRLGNAVRASLQHEQIARLQSEAILSEQRLQALLDQLPTAAIRGHDLNGNIRFWNRTCETLYGYSRSEAIGANLLDLIIPTELHSRITDALQQVANGTDLEASELDLLHKDGYRVPVYSSHLVMRRPGQDAELFSVDIDLRERKRHEAELAHAANHDALTGLPNRHLLHAYLRQASARAKRSGLSFAICYIDLDRFKPINDQHGHHIGDKVLIAVSRRLLDLVREDDVVARLGGDEFVLLLEGVDDIDALKLRLQLILDALTRNIVPNDERVAITASMGVAFFPRDGDDPDILMRQADLAMYQAKSDGRNCFRLFDTRMKEESEQRSRNRRALATAIADDQFLLFYQPIVNLLDRRLVGVEALVRWQHPDRGLLAPADFLDNLSGEALESQFGERIFELAIDQISRWNTTGLNCRVSVNLTGQHLLQDHFIDRLQQLLSRYPDVAPNQLVLEILETIAIADLDRVAEVLHRCRQQGMTIALDDFGTGYSSLSRLRQLPVDMLKIDRSFVAGMLADQGDYSIVRSAIELARVFDLEVIAEGPETTEHLVLLKDMGCNLVQGHGIAAAMPAEAFADWLADWGNGLQTGVWPALMSQVPDRTG